jgi:hypothetical protein
LAHCSAATGFGQRLSGALQAAHVALRPRLVTTLVLLALVLGLLCLA